MSRLTRASDGAKFEIPDIPEPDKPAWVKDLETSHPETECPVCHAKYNDRPEGARCQRGVTRGDQCPGEVKVTKDYLYFLEAAKRAEAQEKVTAFRNERHTPSKLTVRRASEVPDQPVVRAFGGRLLQGTFSLVVGPGDAGKGMLIADIVSHLTNGQTFPNERQARPPMNVLILTTEDSEGIFKARLRAAGADLDRVFFLTGPNVSVGGLQMPARITLHDDASELLRTAKEINAGAMMIETLVEHFGDRNGKTRHNTHSDVDVRQALIPLRTVCEQAALFGLAVLHPRKSSEGGIADSISGSGAFRNVARVVNYVYRDPDDDSPNPVRLLMSDKSNYSGRPPASLRFRIVSWDEERQIECLCPPELKNSDEGCGHIGRIVWEDDLIDDRTAEDIWQAIVEAKRQRNDFAVQEAEDFLERVLRGPEIVPLETMHQMAKEERINPSALKRAKRNLKVVSVKTKTTPATVIGWRFEDDVKRDMEKEAEF